VNRDGVAIWAGVSDPFRKVLGSAPRLVLKTGDTARCIVRCDYLPPFLEILLRRLDKLVLSGIVVGRTES
jgi:hypothetical protein